MARKGRVIGAVLILCFIFFLSSRKSGSHPRDLRKGATHDSPQKEHTHQIIKQALAHQDSMQDRYKEQHDPGKGDMKGLSEQINAIAKDLPEEEIQWKAPKKKPQNLAVENEKEDTGPGVILEKQDIGVDKHDMVSINKDEVVLKEYDPAKGITFWNAF